MFKVLALLAFRLLFFGFRVKGSAGFTKRRLMLASRNPFRGDRWSILKGSDSHSLKGPFILLLP